MHLNLGFNYSNVFALATVLLVVCFSNAIALPIAHNLVRSTDVLTFAWVNKTVVPQVGNAIRLLAVPVFFGVLLASQVLGRKLSKRSIITFGVCGFLLVGGFVAVTPAVNALIAHTGYYYLDTPLPLADYYVGAYTNSTYFAINGSNWDNYLVHSNHTYVEEMTLGNTTSGMLYMSAVRHNYSLVIPSGVVVAEHFNETLRRFTSDVGSSPYTVCVDSVVSGYYLAEDCEENIFLVNANASYVFETIVDGIIGSGIDGRIFVMAGEYDFGTNHINLWDKSGAGSVTIEGVTKPSKQGTIFKGNGTYLITSNTTSWIQGASGVFHTIKNIRFEHTTPNANAITVDFGKTMVSMENVWISNQNATRQGTGLTIGDGSAGNTGMPFSWQDIAVSMYGTGMNVSVDHLVATNIQIWNSSDYFFWWQGSGYSTFTNLQLVGFTTPTTDAHLLYFKTLGQSCYMNGLNIEGATYTFTEPIITVVPSSKTMVIDGFYMQGDMDTGVPFWNRTDNGLTAEYYVHLNAHGGDFLSVYAGKTTVANGEWIPHLLLGVPYYVDLTFRELPIVDDVGLVIGVVSSNSTHFQVGLYWTNGTAYTADNIDIYWYASINRR